MGVSSLCLSQSNLKCERVFGQCHPPRPRIWVALLELINSWCRQSVLGSPDDQSADFCGELLDLKNQHAALNKPISHPIEAQPQLGQIVSQSNQRAAGPD